MKLQTLHRFSGVFISLFVALHLANHAVSVAGAEQHIALMQTLRLIYRNAFAETLLLLAVLFQIISGVKFFIKGKTTPVAKTPTLQLQRYSGLYLALFLIVHVGAVMAGRYVLELDTNFYFGVAGLNTFPLNLFFVPYYALAIIAFFGHIAAIHHLKMQRTIIGLTPTFQSLLILVFGILLTVVILYGLTNGFGGVEIPKEYELLK
ncbi:MAG: hypothetical protein ACK4GN_04970 [Runella sp.]